jgi:hypothetical protein
MLLKISCPSRHHLGIPSAERLPAELRCWQCGEVRLVEKGRRIVSKLAFQEWLLGSGDAELIDAPSGG